MRDLSKVINDINDDIDKDLNSFTRENRAFVAKKVLEPLRDFVEALSLYVFTKEKSILLNYNYDNIQEGLKYIKNNIDTFFIFKFHGMLQGSISHYYENENISERLMIKYYEYLILMKKYLKSNYNLDILKNLYKFQVYQDPKFLDYYESIAKKVDGVLLEKGSLMYGNRYYVQKVTQFIVYNDIYYEITLSSSNDYASKFDRTIVYTKTKILENYSINVKIERNNITVFGKQMPINILKSWMVSIRPCEINNFLRIFGLYEDIKTSNNEYVAIMEYLTKYRINLVDMIKFNDNIYLRVKNILLEKVKSPKIILCLDRCKELIEQKKNGQNILNYLLYHLNNRIIKDQYEPKANRYLSGLFLKNGCIPFDTMPYNSAPINHNIIFPDLINCIEIEGHEHELLARKITNNVEQNAKIYTPEEDLQSFENLENLIELYNSQIYEKHQGRKINKLHNYLFIQQYENDIVYIINKLIEKSKSGILGYNNSFNTWYNEEGNKYIDCEDKLEILKNIFSTTKLALIYGAAGTGKTYMIDHISNFYKNERKLFLTQTNSALNNLKNKVHGYNGNSKFETVYQFVNNEINTSYDILIIDECSVISNKDIRAVLEKVNCTIIVLVGDVYQIESIRFGNWFNISRYFVSKDSISDLTFPFRTTDVELIKLWNKVRNLENDIIESIDRNEISSALNETLFSHDYEDEIILCLNYDGLYGINNINRFLQANNPNIPVYWDIWTYKIDDPIIFNDTNRFSGILYNNLKGKIVKIVKSDNDIQFDIEIGLALNELNLQNSGILLVDCSKPNTSIIRFSVNKKSTDSDDDNADNNVPFQVAYATSIHKAQGLEFDSVKIVITYDVEDKISLSIFYTAITRAKKNLKIYWTPESENIIIKNFTSPFNIKDACLLSEKYKLKMHTENQIK
ncbi:MAG: AAA family ATPase [Clostridia bacterium]